MASPFLHRLFKALSSFCSGETSPLREHQAELGELESTASPRVEAYSLKIKKSTPEKMPSEAEIEDFFAAAEKKIQKQFAEK